MATHHASIPHSITPAEALAMLREGNFRFMNNLRMNRDLLKQMNDTQDGQWPFAAILSCMDSRTSAELIFDQGLGDIFSIRIAGNIVSPGILGSLEYATAIVGSKLILVLGHTNCGAIKGACDGGVKLGHLTELLGKIQPAVDAEQTTQSERNGQNTEFVNNVTLLNVKHSAQQILEESEVIRKLVEEGKVGIVPAIYDVSSGQVRFCEDAWIIGPKTQVEELSTV